jgi:hypothetical protein
LTVLETDKENPEDQRSHWFGLLTPFSRGVARSGPGAGTRASRNAKGERPRILSTFLEKNLAQGQAQGPSPRRKVLVDAEFGEGRLRETQYLKPISLSCVGLAAARIMQCEQYRVARMPKSDDELEKIAEPTSSGAPYSLDTTVISGWRLLQIAGAIFMIYIIFHFLEKHW